MKRRRSPTRSCARRPESLEPRQLLSGPGDDVGDTRADARSLAFTYAAVGSFADEIGRPEDIDIFRLDLQLGDRVDLRLVSTADGENPFYGILRVFGAADRIERRGEERLSFVAAGAAPLHVGVSGLGNDQYDPDVVNEFGLPFTGSYRLEFTVTPGAAETPDDTLAGAKSVALLAGESKMIAAQIESPLDVDIVTIELAAGNVLRAGIASGSAVARVFDSNGQEIETDLCLDVDAGEIAVTAQNTGLHYVAVSGAGNLSYDPRVASSGAAGTETAYQLSLTREAGAPLADGDTLSVAIPICFASTDLPRERSVEGDITGPGDVDLYRVQLAAGEAIESTVVVGGNSILTSLLRVFDAEGQAVADNVAAVDAGAENPPLRFNSANGGTFFVGVSAVGNVGYDPNAGNGIVGQSFGRYTLLARVTAAEPDDDDVPPDAELPALPPRPTLPAESVANGQLGSSSEIDSLPIEVSAASRLEARVVNPEGAPARALLTLSDAAGNVLVTSSAGSARLAQHLPPGNYVLTVRAGDGVALPTDYRLITRLLPATSPLSDYLAAEGVSALATADFTGDGVLDAVLANALENALTFLVGLGDGTFAPQTPVALAGAPSALVAADLTGDGRIDLAVGRRESDRLTLFVGASDGWFASARELTIGVGVQSLAAADWNGDGFADLAAAVSSTQSLVIQTDLDETNGPAPRPISIPSAASAVVAADLDGDGRVDLAAALRELNQVVALEQGDGGSFTTRTIEVGSQPSDLVAADFDGDGDLDLAVGLAVDGNVTLLRRGADDGYDAETIVVDIDRTVASAGVAFRTIVLAADFNGDELPDLAVANTFSRDVAVLLSDDDGFRTPLRTGVARAIVALDAGDLNGDGRPDLIAANDDGATHGLAVRIGRGNGTFRQATRPPAGSDPHAITTADLNSDGRLDLISTSFSGVTIQLGAGDGAFAPAMRIAADQPQAVVAGDFNRDGRPDLAATFPFRGADSQVDNRLGVWVGLGDGTFRDAVFYATGQLPLDLVAADWNGDGALDIATANGASNDIRVHLGSGDGVFAAAATLAAGLQPSAITTEDIDGDGKSDLLVANELSDNLTIWFGNGNGQFGRKVELLVGDAPIDVLAADLDGDDRIDFVSADRAAGALSFLFQEDGGTFTRQSLAIGEGPRSLALLPTSGAGAPRLAVALDGEDRVVVLERSGPRQWTRSAEYAAGNTPIGLIVADWNQDRRDDLAALNAFSNDVTLLFGASDGIFRDAGAAATEFTQAAPVMVDLNGDGALDALVVRQSGEVLLRSGRVGAEGVFEAPLIVNRDRRASAVVVLSLADGPALATLDRDADRVSIYRANAAGDFTFSEEIVTGVAPIRIAAGDVNGDGLSDIAVARAGSAGISLFIATAAGGWQTQTIATGVASPTDLAIVDADGVQGADLALADGAAGAVRLYLNDGGGQFAAPLVYGTGPGPYALGPLPFTDSTNLRTLADASEFAPISLEGTAAFTFTNVDGDALPDLLVLNPGSNTFALLTGLGANGLSNPEVFATGDRPTDVAVADFNRDGHADLAVLLLGEERLSIHLGDGQGGFRDGARFTAGNLPRGLAAIDVDRDGLVDLVIGNALGDLMTFRGLGDGDFGPFLRADNDMPLAVADLDGDGLPEIIVANPSLDRLSVQRSLNQQPADGALSAVQIFEQQRDAGLLAPGAVEMADLDADGFTDMLVANRGGNALLVYMGRGDGTFSAARSFYAGTNPAGITIHDVNNDGLLDVVVANAGSNDVSVLLGDAAELLRPGPRLAVGSAPVATEAGDFNDDGETDLLVVNSGADAVSLLFGVGGGFFDDTQSIQFPTGADPRSLLVGQFDGRPGADLVTVNARGGSLTFYSNFVAGALNAATIATGGIRPTSAVARDFNDDGRLDIVVANNASGSLSILLGFDAGLSLAAVVSELGFDQPSSLEPFDFGGEDGSRLLVTHEADEQPHLFSPRAFLPRAMQPAGPLSPSSGLLLTLFQAGFRAFAASILTLPTLSAEFAERLADVLNDSPDSEGAAATGIAIAESAETVARLGLAADAILTGLDQALDGAIAAINVIANGELTSAPIADSVSAVTAWMTAESSAANAGVDRDSLGALLGLIAMEFAQRLDPSVVDAAVAEFDMAPVNAPEEGLTDVTAPRTLDADVGREINHPAQMNLAPITPTNLEQPMILPEQIGAPRPIAAATNVGWSWKLWAAAMAAGAVATGAGGYATQRHWRRRHIEQLNVD